MASVDKEYRFWLVLLFISSFFGYGCYIINRKSFSFSMAAMSKDLGLEKDQLGTILSSFFMLYAFSKLFVGFLTDLLGSPRLLFALGLAISAVINILFGLSSSMWAFSLFWMINGLIQGFGWPPVGKLLRVWVPSESFGRWWSTVSMGINVSAALSSIVFAAITKALGWRFVFFGAGAVGLGMSVVIFLITRDSPESVGLKSITSETSNSSAEKKRFSLRDVLSDWFLWVLSGNYLLFYVIKTSIADWSQMYLIQYREFPASFAAYAIGMLEVGGIVGSLVAGFSSDFLVSKMPRLGVFARLPVICILIVILELFLYVLNHTAFITEQYQIDAVFFMLGLTLYGPIAIWGVLAVENAPKGFEGTAHSVASMASQTGAFLSGYPFSVLVSSYGWYWSFVTLEVTGLIVVVLFGFVFFYKLQKLKAD